MIGNSALGALHERVGSNRLFTRPRGNAGQEHLESTQVDTGLDAALGIDGDAGLFKLTRASWRHSTAASLGRAHGRKVVVVNNADLLLVKPAHVAEVADGSTLGELFNLVGNDGTETTALAGDSLVGDDVELAERNDQEFLEVGNVAHTRIGVGGVSRVADSRKVAAHEADEHAVIGDFEKSLAVDLENGKTDLEENLGAHGQHTVDNAECKDQRERVDVERQEPGEGRDRDLDVDRAEVVVDHGQAALHQRLEHTLVQEGALHRRRVVAWQDPVAQNLEEPECLLLRHVDEQTGDNNVESLAVAKLGVAERVGHQDTTETRKTLVGLVRLVLRQGAVEILFNLVRRLRALACILRQEERVGLRVGEAEVWREDCQYPLPVDYAYQAAQFPVLLTDRARHDLPKLSA